MKTKSILKKSPQSKKKKTVRFRKESKETPFRKSSSRLTRFSFVVNTKPPQPNNPNAKLRSHRVANPHPVNRPYTSTEWYWTGNNIVKVHPRNGKSIDELARLINRLHATEKKIYELMKRRKWQ
jgi:hypothetical protein